MRRPDVGDAATEPDALAGHPGLGATYRTTVDVPRSVGAERVVSGHTLPRRSSVSRVALDGKVVHDYAVRTTNRGLEVTVPTRAGGTRSS